MPRTPPQPHPTPPPLLLIQALLALVAVEVSSRSPGAVVAAALERAVTHPAGGLGMNPPSGLPLQLLQLIPCTP